MRSLTFKLILGFLLVSLTGAALFAVFARSATVKEFDRFALEQMQNDFMANMSAYYRAQGSWVGIAEMFNQEALPPPPLALADQNGYVVVPAGPYHIGEHVSVADLGPGTRLEIEGQVVGTVLPIGGPPGRDLIEEQYLARTSQDLFDAALGATGIALLLGILLARTLTRPLRELTAASRAIAKGELDQQVPIRSQDELGELAVSFNQMSADLARANQLRRQMTADIAHDLRTPLTVITGYIESLRDGVLEPSPARFDVMYQEAQHLTCLVEDLRTLSLADAGELTLNRQSVSPQVLLERLAAAHQHQAEQQSIALQVQTESDLPEINVDPERMAQAMGNLVGNALRHTPDGGQIVLSAQRQADTVLLMVQDNGDGIAPEVLPRIFDRLYRGDESRQQQNGESGLGLAIVKSLVEAHGGRVGVISGGIGHGSAFLIHLPLA
ncbi:MAG: ATP-binding protein [Chloroflexota bacterium]|nr:ATP-binding protein [Chloroflexota bacterium]